MNNQNEAQEFSTSAVSQSSAFIEKNKKILIGVVVGIIVAIAAVLAYNEYIAKPNEEKASYLLSKGQNYFAAGNFDVALNGDKSDFKGLLDIADKYSSTDAGNLAKLYAGLCYAKKGDSKNAIKYLEDFSKQGDALVSPSAIAALGNCYAKDNQIEKAVSLLLEAAKKADNVSLSPIFMIQAGEILESQNKNEEALKLYQEIKTKYCMSSYAQVIDKYIQRATK